MPADRGGRFAVGEVRRHYADLAPTYEGRANAACARAYGDLVRDRLGRCRRVLEIGAGTATLLPGLAASLRVACDLSPAMLRSQRGPVAWLRVAGDAQDLPFAPGSFDGAYAVNVTEHVPEPRRLVAQAERVLAPGGRLLLVTPNGDLERLLDLLERLRLKIPEGPHRFLRPAELAAIGGAAFRVLEHRRFLAFPLGPRGFVRLVDRLALGGGLFQYLLLEKGGADGAVAARAGERR